MHLPTVTAISAQRNKFSTLAAGTLAAGDAEGRTIGLLTAMAALPSGEPTRAALRTRIIEAWLPMARRLARRYAGSGESSEDLAQTAAVGLIKAVDRFDPGRGVDFVNYAIPTILGELKRYFRDRTWSIRVPRRLQEMRLAINEANAVVAHNLGRAPTVADIAAHLQVTEEAVLEGLEGTRAYRATSLSTPTNADGTLEIGDSLGTEDPGYALTELHIALRPALASLNPREQRIIALRFHGNQTQAQIAEQIGVSQMHVSRLLTESLAKLRRHLDPDVD